MRRLRLAERGLSNRPTLIMVARIAGSAVSLINAPLIARALGPDGRGVTSAAIAAFFIIPIILSAGLPLEVRRLAAHRDFAPLVRSARQVSLCAFPFALVLGFFLDMWIFDSLSGREHVILVVGVAMGPLMISWMCDESVLIANQHFRGVALLQLTQPVVNMGLIVIGALFGQLDVSWVLCAYLGGLVATAVVGWISVPVSLRGPAYPVKKLVRDSLPFAGSSVAEAVSNRVDQLIVLPLIGSFNSGLYAVAVTICTIPVGLAHALGASEFRRIATVPPTQRVAAQQRAVRSSIAGGVVLCLILALGTPLAVSVLFGNRFDGAVSSVWLLLVGSVFMIGNYVGSMALVASGRGFSMTIAQIVGAAVGVLALLFLGPLFGANGASMAAALGYISTFILITISVGGRLRETILRPSDFCRALQDLLRTPEKVKKGHIHEAS